MLVVSSQLRRGKGIGLESDKSQISRVSDDGADQAAGQGGNRFLSESHVSFHFILEVVINILEQPQSDGSVENLPQNSCIQASVEAKETTLLPDFSRNLEG